MLSMFCWMAAAGLGFFALVCAAATGVLSRERDPGATAVSFFASVILFALATALWIAGGMAS